MRIIPHSRQSINQDDIDAVSEVMRSDWLTQGPNMDECEAVTRIVRGGS